MLALLRSVSILGSALCLALLLAVALLPRAFERSAIGFAKSRIETELRARVDAASGNGIVEGLRGLSDRLGLQQGRIVEQLRTGLPEVIAEVVERACGCTDAPEGRVSARATRIREAMDARFYAIVF